MRCPNTVCQSTRVRAVGTGKPDTEGLPIPKELAGVNLTRRKRVCLDCKHPFYTVEIAEAEYLFLRQKTGRLESPQPMVHRRL